MKIEVSVEDQDIREKLLDILQSEARNYVTITLRNGEKIAFPNKPVPAGLSAEESYRSLHRMAYSDEVDVWVSVGRDYVEITTGNGPGGTPAFYKITPISEIVSVQYYTPR